jgi:LmbE family N-acetylglucosaminyl deacetylase
MTKNILVIAPHPDDEVLGCGGTMAKLAREGNNVFVLIASKGIAKLYNDARIQNVRAEALRAHEMLGVKQTFFLDYPAPELDTIPLADITRDFAKIIIENKINLLFLPHWGDIHNDHKVVFNAGLVAARPVANSTVKEIFTYETVSETEWAIPKGDQVFIPQMFVDIENTFDKKIEAFGCFKSQVREFPNPRSVKSLEALAMVRAVSVGLCKCEAFGVVRIIAS